MPDSTNAAAIIDALKQQANEILSSALGSTPLQGFAIGSNGNFPYNWQSTLNVTQFNKPTYDWISSNLKAGASPLQQDGSFTNLFLNTITKISWSLSSNDQKKLNDANSNATQQQAAVQNAWIQAFGSLPAGSGTPIDNIAAEIATKWANPPTTLQAIENAINLNQLLNQTPAAGAAVLPVFVNWLNAIDSVLSLQNSVSLNNAYLRRAVNAVQNPTTNNGGITLSNNSVAPAYQVANSVADILNSLKSGRPEVNLQMTVQRSTQNEFTVTVSGHAGFQIPVLDFLTIGVGGNTNYFSSDIATTNNTTTVQMTFPGVNLVNFGPVNFQQAGDSTSWFWMDPIRQAIANGERDVSGFKFSPPPGTDFSKSGPFGYLMGVAISSYPTITIKVQSANYQRIQQTFQQTVSSTVSFLGIPLASATESTYSNKVQVDASNSTVTITISPPPSLVAGTENTARAWILGVQPNYPAA